MDTFSTSPRHARHPQLAYRALLVVAIVAQLVSSFLFNVESSHYVADDINAIELAHEVGFWEYIDTPVDVHRVPLHRAVNYLIHNLLPMNFAAATAFMLACHTLTLLTLYRLLQRINAQPLNFWLIGAYALNTFVLVPLHWWSAGLHRYPFVLAAVISCYCFVRFLQADGLRFAGIAVFSALIATGFYIKGTLIPVYWLALLLCSVNWRELLKYRQQLLAIAVAGSMSIAHVAWYLQSNTYTFVSSPDTSLLLKTSMEIGMSTTAQIPLQMPYRMEIAWWINLIWIIALTAFSIRIRNAWRAILACIVLVALNMLMIGASSRTSQIGPLIMFSARYYYDVLFLLVIFGSIMCRNIELPTCLERWTISPWRSNAVWLAAALALILYAAAGWHGALTIHQPGDKENHWLAARYHRNLMASLADKDINDINLVNSALPACFVYEAINQKPLKLSTYLAWHGLYPHFEGTDKPLYLIDDQGNMRPAEAAVQDPLQVTP